MELVCIREDFAKAEGVPGLVKGNIYHAIEEKVTEKQKWEGYTIQEGTYYHLIETDCWYHSCIFVVLNNEQKEETEVKKEYSHGT